MEEKKTIKQRVKDWWKANKRTVTVGLTFGALGVAFGFIKGAGVTNEMWLEHGFERAGGYPEKNEDGSDLTEANCDDPELLEMVHNS